MFNKNRNIVWNMFKQVFALINKTTGYFFSIMQTQEKSSVLTKEFIQCSGQVTAGSSYKPQSFLIDDSQNYCSYEAFQKIYIIQKVFHHLNKCYRKYMLVIGGKKHALLLHSISPSNSPEIEFLNQQIYYNCSNVFDRVMLPPRQG